MVGWHVVVRVVTMTHYYLVMIIQASYPATTAAAHACDSDSSPKDA